MTVNVTELKTKARATWATGSYHDIAMHLGPMAVHLVGAAKIKPGDRVLDVATGTGVTAITARRAGARVTGLDLTAELLAIAKEEAALAGFDDIEWREGDAEALPYPDASFDVVLSSFGHMFAPQPEIAARELVRVVKPGGRIVTVTHQAHHLIAGVFGAMGRHVPPPAGVPSPMLWGDPATVRDRLGDGVTDLRFDTGIAEFPALAPAHFWRLFSTRYGPTMRALGTLGDDRAKHEAFRRDFTAAVEPYWRDNVVRMGYLLTRATKK